MIFAWHFGHLSLIFEIDNEFIMVLRCINPAISCCVMHLAGGTLTGYRVSRAGGILVVLENTSEMIHRRIGVLYCGEGFLLRDMIYSSAGQTGGCPRACSLTRELDNIIRSLV